MGDINKPEEGREVSEPSQAFVTVDYDDYKPWTLRGVYVVIRDNKHRFETLDEAYEFAHENSDIVLNSSSVDDFKSDLRKFKLN